MLLFNREGDCPAAKLRSYNVHGADDWEELGSMVRRISALAMPTGRSLAAGRRESATDKEAATEGCPGNWLKMRQVSVFAYPEAVGMAFLGRRIARGWKG